MTITIDRQREYIQDVVARVLADDLDRLAGIYRIDAMVELAPELKPYALNAIERMYDRTNNILAIDK